MIRKLLFTCGVISAALGVYAVAQLEQPTGIVLVWLGAVLVGAGIIRGR